MNHTLIEEKVRLGYKYDGLYDEMRKFIEDYNCKECDGGIVYPNRKKYCVHLLRDYKKKFLPTLIELARKENKIIIKNKEEESEEPCQSFLVSRYS